MTSQAIRSACVPRRLRAASRWLAAWFILALLGATAAARAQAVEVRMQGEKFLPAEIEVQVGTTVRWINAEKRTSHSVIFAAEGLPETERLFPGESWQRTFDKPGRYPYVCGPHPDMKGVVIVVP